jgi:hypothetical protein
MFETFFTVRTFRNGRPIFLECWSSFPLRNGQTTVEWAWRLMASLLLACPQMRVI